MNGYIKNPKSSSDYRHNLNLVNEEYKKVYEKSEKINKSLKEAKEIRMRYNYVNNNFVHKVLHGKLAPTTKEMAKADEIFSLKKIYDKKRKDLSNQANKLKKLAEEAEGRETALKIGKIR